AQAGRGARARRAHDRARAAAAAGAHTNRDHPLGQNHDRAAPPAQRPRVGCGHAPAVPAAALDAFAPPPPQSAWRRAPAAPARAVAPRETTARSRSRARAVFGLLHGRDRSTRYGITPYANTASTSRH